MPLFAFNCVYVGVQISASQSTLSELLPPTTTATTTTAYMRDANALSYCAVHAHTHTTRGRRGLTLVSRLTISQVVVAALRCSMFVSWFVECVCVCVCKRACACLLVEACLWVCVCVSYSICMHTDSNIWISFYHLYCLNCVCAYVYCLLTVNSLLSWLF